MIEDEAMKNLTFVTFGSLAEGARFYARGRVHFKGEIGLFQTPPDLGNKVPNAFYYKEQIGVWAHFNEHTLVQPYSKEIHDQPATVLPFVTQNVASP